MTMSIVTICTFRLIIIIVFVPFALSQSTSDAPPGRLCHFVGAYQATKTDYNFQFSIADLPKRCDAVVYGNYNFDAKLMDDTTMFRADEDAISSMTSANISVYTFVGYDALYEPWHELLDPVDQNRYNDLVTPLVKKIKDLRLSGIVLGISDIYNGTSNLPSLISNFTTKIKQQVPTLKFGLPVSGTDSYEKFSNNELFDFTITNSVIDVYVIKMFTRGNQCDQKILSSGTLITSPDRNALTLKKITEAVTESKMDKNKTFAKLHVAVLTPGDEGYYPINYAQYCNSSNAANTSQWCEDNTQKLYSEGMFVRQFFHGISIGWLDFDDFLGTCECGKFPATNTLFDGWDGVPVTHCPKMDVR